MLGLFLLTVTQAPLPARIEAPQVQRPAAVEAARAPAETSPPPAPEAPAGSWAPLAPPAPEASAPDAPADAEVVPPVEVVPPEEAPPATKIVPPPTVAAPAPHAPAAASTPAPVSFQPVGVDPDWRRDRYELPAPRWKGTGGFITAGLLGTAILLKQATLTGLCGGEGNCGLPGVSDRIVFAGSVGAAMAGAARRGRWDAARDVKHGQVRDLRMRARVGLGVAAAGVVLVAMDTAFNGACYLSGRGPYVQPDNGFLFPGCRTGLSTAIIDVGYAATVVGFPMAIHARVYRRNARARLAVAPWRTQGGGGLMVSGRF